MAAGNLAVDPVMQLATIGVLGVGAVGRMASACACHCPDAGHRIIGGPLLGVLDPKAALGDLMTPSYPSRLRSFV